MKAFSKLLAFAVLLVFIAGLSVNAFAVIPIDDEGEEPIQICEHIPAEAVTENMIGATEQSEGSYDSVVYCTLCGEELSRNRIVIPALIPVHTISGSDVVWTFNAGTLTVYGSGTIKTYSSTSMPWYDYRDQTTSIVIGDGITSIGNYAFFEFRNAASLTLGSSVTSIGVNAFSKCYSLTEVEFPESLTGINNYAFNNCSGITLMVFNSAAAPSFAANALANTKAHMIYQSTWSGFTKDKYAGKGIWLVDHIGGNCGTPKYSLDRGVMTISVKSGTAGMRSYGKGQPDWYNYRDEILSLVVGEGVTSVGAYTFYDCANLSEISLGSSVTKLDTCCFYGCTSLTEITLPASVTTLNNYAFSYCTGITDIEFTGETAPATVGSSAFSMVKAKALYPATQSWEAFNKVGYGGAIYWTDNPYEEIIGGNCGNKSAWILVDGTLTIYGQEGTRSYGSKTDVPWYEYREEITRIVVENGITSIGNYMFMGCENVTEVYLSNTLRKICVNAFSTCRGLTSITIPASVTDIYAYAFNKCSGLQTVTFEGNAADISINGHAFENTGIKL